MVLFLKLGFLAIRQASKPLANRARLFSESSDVFRAITLSVGRSLHRWTVYADRLALGKGSGFVTPLNEKLAISRGADFLSEGIVYSIASITVLYEYRHQQRLKLRSEQAAREAEERRIEAGRQNEARQWDEFRELRSRITLMEEQLWSMRRQQEEARPRGWFGG